MLNDPNKLNVAMEKSSKHKSISTIPDIFGILYNFVIILLVKKGKLSEKPFSGLEFYVRTSKTDQKNIFSERSWYIQKSLNVSNCEFFITSSIILKKKSFILL